jgi:DNA-directed RNA polymerase beta subunit
MPTSVSSEEDDKPKVLSEQSSAGRQQYLPEVASDDEDLLLNKYYTDHYQYQYLIDSYNNFISKGLAACLAARPYILDNGQTAILRLIRVEEPKFDIDGERYPLTHKEAILTGKTYSGRVIVRLEILNAKNHVVSRSKEGTLLDLPIMVYSNLCYAKGKIQVTKKPSDPGCYFVVNGTRNVVLLFEKSRQYQFTLRTDRDRSGLPYVSQTSETSFSTAQTNIYANRITNKNIGIGVRVNKFTTNKQEEPKEQGKAKKQKDPDINVIDMCYIISTLLSKKPLTRSQMEKFFISTLEQVIPKNQFFKCWSAFASTINDHKDTIETTIVENISKHMAITKLSYNEQRVSIAQYIKERIFPMWPDAEKKISTLMMMTARLLQCLTGSVKMTNMDHWGTKSLLGPGEVFEEILRRKYIGVVRRTISTDSFKAKGITADTILSIILSQNLDTKFISEFKGLNNNKKVNKAIMAARKPQSKPAKAVAIDASPINSLDLRSILTKTRNNADKNSTSFSIRATEGSMWRFMCSYKATENSKCGITKFIACTTMITQADDPNIVIMTLLNPLKSGQIMMKTISDKEYNLPVILHGPLIGFVNSTHGYDNLIMLKRHGIIPRHTCIVKTTAGCIEIYVNASRLMSPVVPIDPATGRPKIYSEPYRDNWKQMSSIQLINRGLIEYLDNYEIENQSIHLAETFATFTNYEIELSRLENIRDQARREKNNIFETNTSSQINSMIRSRPTYASIHPIAAYGVTPALVPFANHQQACRTAYADKMQDQGIHKVLDDPYAHIDMYNATYGTTASLASSISRITGLHEEISGQTMTVAFLATYMNQEDSAIVSRTAIENGKLRYIRTITIKETEESEEQKFGRVNPGNVHPYRFRHIDENGMPRTGVYLGPEDCVIGKYEIEDRIINDRSRYLERDEEGIVREVVSYQSTKSNKSLGSQRTVSVVLDLFRSAGKGDKIASRHSQKYIISQVRAGVDMPFSQLSGNQIDVMLNPLCVPTRMTTGTLLELLLMKSLNINGKTHDAAAHKTQNVYDAKQTLIAAGYESRGFEDLIDGRTGMAYTSAEIFVGPSRISLLAHIAEYKIQCRARGKENQLTGQAESSKAGNSRNKGQKISEHERNKFIMYGASFLIHERMNESCDGYTVVACKICSSMASYDPLTNKFKCNTCGSASHDETCADRFGKFIEPRTAKYISVLLASMGIDLRPRFVTKEEYLKSAGRRIIHDETLGPTGYVGFDEGDEAGLDLDEASEEDIGDSGAWYD